MRLKHVLQDKENIIISQRQEIVRYIYSIMHNGFDYDLNNMLGCDLRWRLLRKVAMLRGQTQAASVELKGVNMWCLKRARALKTVHQAPLPSRDARQLGRYHQRWHQTPTLTDKTTPASRDKS